MKFVHLIRHDTAVPNQQLYVNIEKVNWIEPLPDGSGSLIMFQGGGAVTVTAQFKELIGRLANMAFCV